MRRNLAPEAMAEVIGALELPDAPDSLATGASAVVRFGFTSIG
jgi:hypothetical protein